MEYHVEVFTTNRNEGWIEVIRKTEVNERLNGMKEAAIAITATGWANTTSY